MIPSPPFDVGAENVTVDVALPGVATGAAGALGTVSPVISVLFEVSRIENSPSVNLVT